MQDPEYYSGVEHITALQYLIENGFVIERGDLGFGGSARQFQFTDRGRKLKESGSIAAFQKLQFDDDQRELHRAVMEKRTYLIQASIALATGVAALYYLIEIIKTLSKCF